MGIDHPRIPAVREAIGLLTGEEIAALGIVVAEGPIPQEQIQPNGIDLRLDAVWRTRGMATMGTAAADRVLPAREVLEFGRGGWLHLAAGTYGIRFAEQVRMPPQYGGLAYPRSSLLRMGVTIPTAVWDAGYSGRGETIMQILNAEGVRVQRGARVAQLVVFRLTQPAAPYAGAYQGENLG